MTDPTSPVSVTGTTVEELLAKLPAAWRPIAAQYVPALLAMTTAEVASLIDMLANRQVEKAWAAMLAKLPNSDLIAEWNATNAAWEAENRAESQRRAVFQEAASAVLRTLLAIALALVGL